MSRLFFVGLFFPVWDGLGTIGWVRRIPELLRLEMATSILTNSNSIPTDRQRAKLVGDSVAVFNH